MADPYGISSYIPPQTWNELGISDPTAAPALSDDMPDATPPVPATPAVPSGSPIPGFVQVMQSTGYTNPNMDYAGKTAIWNDYRNNTLRQIAQLTGDDLGGLQSNFDTIFAAYKPKAPPSAGFFGSISDAARNFYGAAMGGVADMASVHDPASAVANIARTQQHNALSGLSQQEQDLNNQYAREGAQGVPFEWARNFGRQPLQSVAKGAGGVAVPVAGTVVGSVADVLSGGTGTPVIAPAVAAAWNAAYGAGSSRNERYEFLENQSDVQLRQWSPEYAKLRDGGIPKERVDAIMSDTAHMWPEMLANAVTMGGIGYFSPGGALTRNLTGRIGRALSSGIDMGLLGATGQGASNVADRQINPDASLTKGVIDAGASGFIGGAALGAIHGQRPVPGLTNTDTNTDTGMSAGGTPLLTAPTSPYNTAAGTWNEANGAWEFTPAPQLAGDNVATPGAGPAGYSSDPALQQNPDGSMSPAFSPTWTPAGSFAATGNHGLPLTADDITNTVNAFPATVRGQAANILDQALRTGTLERLAQRNDPIGQAARNLLGVMQSRRQPAEGFGDNTPPTGATPPPTEETPDTGAAQPASTGASPDAQTPSVTPATQEPAQTVEPQPDATNPDVLPAQGAGTAGSVPAVPDTGGNSAGTAPVAGNSAALNTLATPAAPVLQNRDRSSAGAIAQMNAIAANPDATRLSFSRDFANGAPVVEANSGVAIPADQLGKQDIAVTADGRRIPVQYAAVEADSLLPSNRADGTPNAAYANGTPNQMRAVAGNARVVALQEAYARGTADNYRAGIGADAALTGIAAATLAKMRKPVLVRVMPREAVTRDIGDVSNTSGTAALSATEQAANDMARVNSSALAFDDSGTPTAQAVREFVRAMPVSEQVGLLNPDGSPTRQAVDRLMAATFQKAYGDPELVRLFAQASDPEARTVLGAMAKAAGSMAKLDGAGDLDIRSLVVDAARLVVNAARRGVKVADLARQGDIAMSPEARVFMRLFATNIRSGKRIAEVLQGAAELAYSEASKQDTDMFGKVPRATRQQILESVNDDTAGPQNLGLPVRGEPAEQNSVRGAADATRPADNRPAQEVGAAGSGEAGAQRAAGQGTEVGTAPQRNTILPGDVFRTTTGRETTPYPKYSTHPNDAQATKNLIKERQWLKDNAIAEAKARGDEFNLRQWEALNPRNWSPADGAAVRLYLFDDEEGLIAGRRIDKTGNTPTEVSKTPNHARSIDDGQQRANGIPAGLPSERTAASERLERGINRSLRQRGDPNAGKFRAETIPAARLPDALNTAIRVLEQATGTRAIIFRDLSPGIDDFNGVRFPDGSVFINENNQFPITLTAAHEWLHNMRGTDPDLYGQLAEEVRRQGNLEAWQKRLWQEKDPRWHDPDIVTEELTAAATADAMTDPQFLDRLARNNPGLFRRIAQAFLDFLKSLTAKWHDAGSNKYLADVARFRDMLEKVLNEYSSRRERAAPAEEPLLTNPTPEELRQRAERQNAAQVADAASQREAEQRAQADEQAKDFRLTGSDRGADRAEAAGQNALFVRRGPEPVDMPDAVIGHPLGVARNHADYEAAKGGNPHAAARLVKALVTPDIIQRVRDAIGDEKPTIVAVHANEAAGRNKIPMLTAVRLSEALGLPVNTKIVQSVRAHRTGMGGLDRVFKFPEFYGPVEPGKSYFLVDDALTQGGTLASLASHIRQHGGRVVGFFALTGKDYSATLRLSPETLNLVRERHGKLESSFQAATGRGFDALTQSEGRYLANVSSNTLRNRILAERRTRDGGVRPENLAGSQTGVSTDESPGTSSRDISFSRRSEDTNSQTEAPHDEGLSVSGNTEYGPPGQVLFSRRRPIPARERQPDFYSALSREVEDADMKSGNADSWKALVKSWVNKGLAKADEVEWTGLNEWLDMQQGKISRDSVAGFLRDNGVRVETVPISSGKTRYNQWRVPGGRNYREVLLTKGETPAQKATREATQKAMLTKAMEAWLPREKELADRAAKARHAYDLAVDKYDRSDEKRYSAWEKAREDYVQNRINYQIMEHAKGIARREGGTPESHMERARHRITIEDSHHATEVANLRNFFEWQNPVSAVGKEFKDTPEGRILFKEYEGAEAEWHRYQDTKPEMESLPSIQYHSPHWRGYPDVLAHVRLTDRKTPEGKPVLFVEEIQSDWAQQRRNNKQVLDAPFTDATSKWTTLALKRIIKLAVDEGYGRVAFARGEQNAEHYDLSKQVDGLSYTKREDGTLHLTADHKGREVFSEDNVKPDRLVDLVGKDIAEKIANGEGTVEKKKTPFTKIPYETRTLSGLDLKVGAHGMHAFYDSIIPNVARGVLKKLGGGEINLGEVEGAGGGKHIGFDITDALREKAQKGMPLFQRRSAQDQRAERAAVKAATSGAVLQAVRNRLRNEFDHEDEVHGTVDGDEVPYNEDEEDTDDRYAERYRDAINNAVDRHTDALVRRIRTLDDIDSIGTKEQAFEAARAWLDEHGIEHDDSDGNGGSSYLYIPAPEGADEETEDKTLKLRFSNHRNQSGLHTATEHNWVEKSRWNSLRDMLDAARRFAAGETGVGEQINFSRSHPGFDDEGNPRFGQREGLFGLPDIPVTKLTGRELGNPDGGRAFLRANADKVLKNFAEASAEDRTNPDTGMVLAVTGSDRGKLLRDSGQRTPNLQTMAALPAIVKRAVLGETHPDTVHQNEDVQAVHELYAPVEIKGVPYRAKLAVLDYRWGKNVTRQSLHALQSVELEKTDGVKRGSDVADSHSQPSGAAAGNSPSPEPRLFIGSTNHGDTMSIADLMRGAQRDNGEPFDETPSGNMPHNDEPDSGSAGAPPREPPPDDERPAASGPDDDDDDTGDGEDEPLFSRRYRPEGPVPMAERKKSFRESMKEWLRRPGVDKDPMRAAVKEALFGGARQPHSDRLADLITWLFDYRYPIEQVLRHLGDSPIVNRFRVTMRNFEGATQWLIRRFTRGDVRAMEQFIADAYDKQFSKSDWYRQQGKDGLKQFMEDLGTWGNLVMHGRERNAEIARKTEGRDMAGSGATNEQIAQWEQALRERVPGLDAFYRKLYAEHLKPMNELRDAILKKAGLLTDAMIAARPKYDWYVPLKGDPREGDPGYESYGGSGGSTLKSPRFREAMGRAGTLADNPIQNVIEAVQDAYRQAGYQQFKSDLIDVLKNVKGAKVLMGARVNDVPDSREIFEKYVGPDGIVRERLKTGAAFSPDTLIYRNGDHTITVDFGNQKIRDALAQTNRDAVSGIFALPNLLTRYMRAIFTRYNPMFPFNMKLRDMGQQMLYAMADAPVKNKASVVMNALYNNGKFTLNPFGKEYRAWMERYQSLGGSMMFTDLFHGDTMANLTDEIGKLAGVNGVYRAKAYAEKLNQLIDGFHNHIEMSSRVSMFKALVDAGVPEGEAALYTKNLLNYETKGTWGKQLNSLYTFSTTSLYDGRRFLQAVRTPRGAAVFAAQVAASMGLYAMMSSLSGTDDDGIPKLDKVPLTQSGRYLTWIDPNDPDNHGFKIPLPYGSGRIAMTIAAAIWRHIDGVDDLGTTLAHVTNEALAGNLSPLEPVDIDPSKNLVKWAVQEFAPTILKPAMQLAYNQSGQGAPIHPEEVPGKLNFEQVKTQTPTIFSQAAKLIYDKTGLDVFPDTLRFATQNWLGQGAMEAVRGISLAQGDRGDQTTLGDYPLVGTWASRSPLEDAARFRDNYNDVKQMVAERDYAKQNGDDAAASKFPPNLDDMQQLYKDADSQVRSLQRQVKDARAMEDRNERIAALQNIARSVRAIQMRANKAFGEIQPQQ